MPNWGGPETVEHQFADGEPISVKRSLDGKHALIAEGHVVDIQDNSSTRVDHVHIWMLDSGDFRMHDLRRGAPMFPNIRDDEKERPTREQDLRHETMIATARQLLAAGPSRQTIDEAKKLDREWRSGNRPSPAHQVAFRNTIDSLFELNARRIDDLKQEWASNRAAKERVVGEAESLASSGDLKSAGDRMRALGDEWKRIGQCEKGDADRLWARFNAARTRLRERKDREFEKRKQEWASNRAAKEQLVGRMSSLANSSDLRSAKDEARSLSDKWRAIGPCEKSDNDRLRSAFNDAKNRLFERAKQEAQQRNVERRQRAAERVSRLEDQLHRVEASIYRANDSYSRALSARSPSMNNPNWARIASNQRERISNSQQKLSSLQIKKSEVVNKLMEARSRLNQLY